VAHDNNYRHAEQYSGERLMKRAYLSYVALWLIVVSIFVAQGVTQAKPPNATTGDFTLTSTSGSAFKINDTSQVESASIILQGTYSTVGKDANMIKLTVTSGSVTINGVTYDLQRGEGVYNPGTGKIVITALVDVQPGQQGRNLILYGAVSSGYYYYSQLGGDVTFRRPQSKLSGAYFLAIDGTLTLTV
jgi:hypothetical protein